ncbi:hypothetical protein GGQ59_000780 [Parvularcula dongshanensis]|uniref:Glycosyltransferase RgtA/B/C/D-like domain-containing protein n=2 Tax=Parvularcula dongshanensis TaxID=1173995 RepID=A0A840I2K3_9PROT|nr:hypothetical protein [Parvularcula dongshanensis]
MPSVRAARPPLPRPAPLLFVWFAAALVLCVAKADVIASGMTLGPDDHTRLVQVRDLLSGQGFQDVTQYRLGGAQGLPMHWSRLVDLPIAGVIAVLAPVVGPSSAERMAVVIVPLLALLALLGTMGWVLRSMVRGALVPVGLAAAALLPDLAFQFAPGRIDHHAWQAVAAAACLLGLLVRVPWRGGLLIGGAGAVWAQISTEALPYLAGFALITGVASLRSRDEAARAAVYLGSLAVLSLLLFAALRPRAAWSWDWCDALGAGHLAAFAVAGLVVAPLPFLRRAWARAGLLALGAGGAGVAFAAIAPTCLANPFSAMDPVVQEVWYASILEGLPITAQPGGWAASFVVLALLGLSATAFVALHASGEARDRWLRLFCASVVAVLVALAFRRASGVAELYLLPGLVALLPIWWRWARRREALLPRVFGTVLTIVVLCPLTLSGGVGALWKLDWSEGTPRAEGAAGLAAASDDDCTRGAVPARLSGGPGRGVLAPIDAVPLLLRETPHRFLAGPYHRGDADMRKVIDAFREGDEAASAVMRREGLDLVVICPAAAEIAVYAKDAPDGLAALLLRDEAPDWLVPVDLGAEEAVFRAWRLDGAPPLP